MRIALIRGRLIRYGFKCQQIGLNSLVTTELILKAWQGSWRHTQSRRIFDNGVSGECSALLVDWWPHPLEFAVTKDRAHRPPSPSPSPSTADAYGDRLNKMTHV